ncbi:hypothetical protein CJJ23_00335 [Mycoplasmopsis agassizii]|uniref:Uncharacterized protein n=1 Tax=Mycoplasmopsis agassizii TaxID=33922 RepID=A0A269TK00_9BACT|nr:hypothetical protein [Mycoplasmopsis agassizii]PAK21779.1 hypothetical protein CJJ23_00335 [Mycoplasmopsis agassizii]
MPKAIFNLLNVTRYTPTDVDLRIEKYNPRTSSWETVASSTSGTSNVEFIRHNITESTSYRAVVKQYSGNKGAQNVKGALAYVVQ